MRTVYLQDLAICVRSKILNLRDLAICVRYMFTRPSYMRTVNIPDLAICAREHFQ